MMVLPVLRENTLSMRTSSIIFGRKIPLMLVRMLMAGDDKYELGFSFLKLDGICTVCEKVYKSVSNLQRHRVAHKHQIPQTDPIDLVEKFVSDFVDLQQNRWVKWGDVSEGCLMVSVWDYGSRKWFVRDYAVVIYACIYIYVCVCVCVTVCIYVYLCVNECMYMSSSSCHATGTDIPDPLLPLVPIVHRLFRATSRNLTSLLNVCSSWSSRFCPAICGGP